MKKIIRNVAISLIAGLLAASAFAAQPWREGVHYSQGEHVTYRGRLYVALQSHDAVKHAGWTPERAPSLWELVEPSATPFPHKKPKNY